MTLKRQIGHVNLEVLDLASLGGDKSSADEATEL